MKILVVDDDALLRRGLTIGLQAHGHQVIPAADGRTALDSGRNDDPDLVILDLGLPDTSGLEVLRQLREFSDVPVLVLSARSGSTEKVQALDAGADDYVTKPFSIEELLARLRVFARRSTSVPERVDCGDLVVDFQRGTAQLAGVPVRFTPTQWRILDVLARSRGTVVSQSELLRGAWGPSYEQHTHYLRVYVATLRKKIELDPAQPHHLVTVPGVGYRLDVDHGVTAESGA